MNRHAFLTSIGFKSWTHPAVLKQKVTLQDRKITRNAFNGARINLTQKEFILYYMRCDKILCEKKKEKKKTEVINIPSDLDINEHGMDDIPQDFAYALG